VRVRQYMQSKRSWGFIIAAVVLAGIAVWAGTLYLKNQEEALRAKLSVQVEKIDIVTPTVNVSPGDIVTMQNMAVRSIPKDLVPVGTVFPNDFSAVEGMVILENIPAGTPLLSHYIEGLERVDKFSSLLKVGERAMTFDIDE